VSIPFLGSIAYAIIQQILADSGVKLRNRFPVEKKQSSDILTNRDKYNKFF
jgi:hypothetical protein